ncbi:MAG TPA: Clp protease N-terminal domain-containing protein [Trebonia sp.]|nr:Clp protease N-terminal domain-containing protein [Trebonia sp.]
MGSHHLLLAALTDANSAAARVLASLGVDLTRAKDALHNADITGTTDELPEEAGRRQMNVEVTGEIVTIVATDEILVASANAALNALGEQASGESVATPGGVIRGADLSGLPAASLAKAWGALHDALSAIATSAEAAQAAQAAGPAETKAATTKPTTTKPATEPGTPSPGTPSPGTDGEADPDTSAEAAG